MTSNFDYKTLAKLLKETPEVALCTVVHTKGSTPRKIGAKMAVVNNGSELGRILGTIGGGAIEQQVRRKALEVLVSGEAHLFEAALSAELGMCCGGQMSVFIEPLLAKPNFIIFGAGHIGQALARQGLELAFEVYVADPRPELLQSENFGEKVHLVADYTSHDMKQLPFSANTYVVIVTHDHQMDQRLVELILQKQFRYAALVGSARKARLTVQRCLNKGIKAAEIKKLLCPAGVDINAQTPEEIAVSIMGQITQCRRQRGLAPFWTNQTSEIQKALAAPSNESVA